MERLRLILLCALLSAAGSVPAPAHDGSTGTLPGMSAGRTGVEVPVRQGDTTVLMGRLDAYLETLDRLSLHEACTESDFIIGSVADSLLRDRIAVKVYRHFRQSKVMGSENVAVYVFDKWFAPFRTMFPDLDEFEQAQLYAYVNRNSLIGCRAQVLKFPDAQGDSLKVPRRHRQSIVYFYSASCPKCLLLSRDMKKLLDSGRHRVDVYAIYTGDDEAVWQKYISENLAIRQTCRTRVHHLRGGDPDFVTAWAVVQTPRLFLVDRKGVIVGRNLDIKALQRLLK